MATTHTKPFVLQVNQEVCQKCDPCEATKFCPTGAFLTHEDGSHSVSMEECIGCFACYSTCPFDAISFTRIS